MLIIYFHELLLFKFPLVIRRGWKILKELKLYIKLANSVQTSDLKFTGICIRLKFIVQLESSTILSVTKPPVIMNPPSSCNNTPVFILFYKPLLLQTVRSLSR